MSARPSRVARSCALVTLLATTGPLARVAHADAPTAAAPSSEDLAAARALFKRAQADEAAGRWSEALDKLRRAIAVKRTPGLLFHIAFGEEKLGKLVAAMRDYSAAQDAARLENNREVLGMVSDPILAIKTRVPTITVNVPPTPPSEVRIDGELVPAATVGSPIPVDVGSHTVEVTAPAQTPYAITVTLLERQAQTVNVLFVPLPSPASVAAPPLVSEPTPSPSRLPAILATAGSAALALVGVGAFAAAGSAQSTYRGKCAGMPSPPCGNATVVRAWDWTAFGAWVAGAGVAATAVVLWTGSKEPAETKAGIELRGGPGWVGLGGRF